MHDFPEGTILIEVRGIYDGWTAAKLPDGTYVNRWPEGTLRHKLTQDWIASMSDEAVRKRFERRR